MRELHPAMSATANGPSAQTPEDTTSMGMNRNPRNSKREMGYRRSEVSVVRSEMKSYRGETAKLEAVLGLVTEKLDKGVTFNVFQNQMKNYILKNIKKLEDVVRFVMDLKDSKN